MPLISGMRAIEIVRKTNLARELYSRIAGDDALRRSPEFAKFKLDGIRDAKFRPCLVLSTGRCGTKLLTRILERRRNVIVAHSPDPELIQQGRIVYESIERLKHESENARNTSEKLAAQIYLTARERVLFHCYQRNKSFVETNNRATFFAHVLRDVIPNIQYVFLYRHPGDFIRSGIRRGWYQKFDAHTIGRLVPNQQSVQFQLWNSYDPVQKIAWLWTETNRYILAWLESERHVGCHQLALESFSTDAITSLLRQMGINVNPERTEKFLRKRINAQKSGDFPKYEHWSDSEKEKVRKICGPVARVLGYEL